MWISSLKLEIVHAPVKHEMFLIVYSSHIPILEISNLTQADIRVTAIFETAFHSNLSCFSTMISRFWCESVFIYTFISLQTVWTIAVGFSTNLILYNCFLVRCCLTSKCGLGHWDAFPFSIVTFVSTDKPERFQLQRSTFLTIPSEFARSLGMDVRTLVDRLFSLEDQASPFCLCGAVLELDAQLPCGVTKGLLSGLEFGSPVAPFSWLKFVACL